MKTRYTILFVLLGIFTGIAQQSYVHQIIFLNEGWYDFFNNTLVVPPSVGSYDPVSRTYQVFDEISEAEFASDVIIDEVIYVAADQFLITYDKTTLERLDRIIVPGIRKLAIWEDQLLVSRGDYLTFFESYFQVYDKNSLELLYELDTENGPAYSTEGIVVQNDSAYVAINNGFVFGQEVGLIGIVDLKNRTYAGEIDLGPDGKNPDNIMLSDNGKIYTLNNKDFSSSSISSINADTRVVKTYDKIAANSGCGTSTYANEQIYYMEYGVDKLARFDVKSAQIVDTLAGTTAYYGLVDDKINKQLVATWTDFFSTGIAHILDYEGNLIHVFEVGISPGSIALDVRTTTSIEDPAWPADAVRVFPVPAHDEVHIETDETLANVKLFGSLGNVLTHQFLNARKHTIWQEDHPAGMYFIEIGLQQGGKRTYRVVKR